jgi:hypothetical protein
MCCAQPARSLHKASALTRPARTLLCVLQGYVVYSHRKKLKAALLGEC